MGQEVFLSPHVEGWDGFKPRINPATIFQRQNVARYILFPEEVTVPRDANRPGPRRLSGDFIHNQFLEMAERGDYTKLSKDRSCGDGGGHFLGGAMMETSKLSGEDFNLFRGASTQPCGPLRQCSWNCALPEISV